MITRCEACLVILVVALGNVSAFDCPKNQMCICEPTPIGTNINCPMKNDSSFTVTIWPSLNSLKIDCTNSSNSSYFPLDGMALTRNENITSMHYKCELPSNNSLGEIARILGATHVQSLDITLPSYSKSAPIRYFLCDFENLKYLTLHIDDKDYFKKFYKYIDDQINWTQFNWTKRKLHLVAGFFDCTLGLVTLNLDKTELISLELGTFDNLKNLQYLYLNSNDIVQLPEDIFANLENLRIITLNNNNFSYLPRNVLRNNAELFIVRMSDNKRNMTTLPNEFFANLTNLGILELRNNGFLTLPEDLFWGCIWLTNINLERNSLQTLPVHIFRDLKELKELELNINRIKTLPDHIFSNINKLVKLDLSKNQITSISEHLFNGLYSLEELNMEENQLMTIAINSFSSLKKLKIVKLSKNHLTLEYVNDRTFYKHCKTLEELYLAENNISEISLVGTFVRSQLQQFNLKYNNITSIIIDCTNSPNSSHFLLDGMVLTKDENMKSMIDTCELPSNNSLGEIARILGATHVEELVVTPPSYSKFAPIRHFLCDIENLKYLTLYIDDMDYFEKFHKYVNDQINWTQSNLTKKKLHLLAGFFNCTRGLERLELDSNDLTSLELSTFDNLKNLTSLNVINNYLTGLQSGIFDELTVLETLSLNINDIVKLPEDIFAKLENLEIIDLSRNNFTYLPKKLLQNNLKLQTFHLIENKRNITTLPNEFFANLTKLQILTLRRNGFVKLPEDLFWGCTSLTNITLEGNFLQTLPVHTFRDLKKLKELELNFNDIETLPDHIFSNANQLVRLDLSKNRITFISEHLFNKLDALEELNIEENQLVTIALMSFSSLKKLKIVKLSKNHLTLKEYPYSRMSPFWPCKSLEELYLANNSISQIFLDWNAILLRLRKLDLKYNNITSITTEDVLFESNFIQVDLTYNKIQHINLQKTEKFENYSQDIYRRTKILVDNNSLHCDCQLYDLLRYIEGKMYSKNQNYFQISPENLTCQSPKELENVRFTYLKSKSLVCVANYSMCPEKCSCLNRPDDNAFIFDCSQRNLTSVPSDIKKPDDLFRLELNFSGNRLTRMPDLKAMELESVKKLILSYNNITEISRNGLSSAIEVLELHNNNLSKIHSDVLEFLKQSTNLIRLTLHENPWECDCDAKEFQRFIRNQTKNVTIYDLHKVKCVGTNISISEYDFCLMNTTTIIGITTAISFIGILVGFFGLYYKYERRIKVWLFAHQWCLWFVTEEELDKEKLYDAFVSYSHKDHDFVVSELVSELENGSTPFKLCLHFRDWVVGEWIPANIISSVENSRRTIVVLSPNFLESVWGRLEFRAAHSQALNEGRARVILILYGDIGPTDNLDPELKAYINMNTYVTWGDPWFWEKLKYALPHQSKLVKHGAARNKISETH